MISIINRSFSLISCPVLPQDIKEVHTESDCLGWKHEFVVFLNSCSEKWLWETMTTQSHFSGLSLSQFLVALSFFFWLHSFAPKRQSNCFKTWTIRHANQLQECEVTRVTYHKKWALSTNYSALSSCVCVCVCRLWGAIVLTVCLGLQHTLKSWWFDL